MRLIEIEKEKSTDWDWSLNDYPKYTNGLKVFSCFSCAGGSTMGYKLAGCEVIGNLEIDKKINDIYISNHNPKYNYCMDIREFNSIPNDELPEELFNLDILDGSPPCTTFSMLGLREKTWGKTKKFREGQKEQTLDDLSFVFLDTVKKLQPKNVIMENVTGLSIGNAYSEYFLKILRKFGEIGYKVRTYHLNSKYMGVPQERNRLFFIATKDKDFDFNKINMKFNYEFVPYKFIKTPELIEIQGDRCKEFLEYAEESDTDLRNACIKCDGKEKLFDYKLIKDYTVIPTLTTKQCMIDFHAKKFISHKAVISAATFPRDFNFCGKTPYFSTGMCVPPLMIKRIVTRCIESGLFKERR